MIAPLKDWQEEGAAWLAPKTGALLALAPGLGKTRTAIEAVERRQALLSKPLGVLVIVPLSLMATWQREVAMWSTLPYSLRTIHGERVLHTVAPVGGAAQVRYTVTNYNTVCPTGKPARVGKFDIMICDESVLLKNRKAQRVTKMRDVRKHAEACWLLSGSPMTKYLDDVWSQLNLCIIDPAHAWKVRGYWNFAKRYCDVKQDQWGWRIEGDHANAFGLLKKDFTEQFFARSQNDVTDLPEWLEEVIEVPMTEYQTKMYLSMEEEALADLPEGDQLLAPNRLAQMTRLIQLASNPVLVQGRMESNKWKAVEEILEYAPGPAIVWVTYKKTAEYLAKRLKCPALTGDTSVEERQRIVDELQAGNLPVIVAHPGVGKFGLTMTRARTMIYLERNFDGDAFLQSMYRTRRIGTVEAPLVYRVLSVVPEHVNEIGKRIRRKATIDHVLDTILQRKTQGAGALVGVRASDFAILRQHDAWEN